MAAPGTSRPMNAGKRILRARSRPESRGSGSTFTARRWMPPRGGRKPRMSFSSSGPMAGRSTIRYTGTPKRPMVTRTAGRTASGGAPGLKKGEVFIAERAAEHDYSVPDEPVRFFEADASLVEDAVCACKEEGCAYRKGVIASGDRFVTGEKERYDAFAASDVALAASGTVSVELAMAGVPHLIAYKVSPLTGIIARKLLKIRFVNLLNLMVDKEVIPELLQEDCTVDNVVETLRGLLEHPEQATRESLEKLGLGDPHAPSDKLAEELQKLARRDEKKRRE